MILCTGKTEASSGRHAQIDYCSIKNEVISNQVPVHQVSNHEAEV